MKLRVLHCLETIGPGGVEQRRLSIGRYLDPNRYEQKLTCSQVIGDFDHRLSQVGIPVEVIGIMRNPFNVSYFRRLLRVIRQFKPHIIHGAVFEGVISAVVGGIIAQTPVIIIEETSEPANRSWRGHFLFKMLSKKADAVVATSPAVYEYITRQIGVPARKAKLILNGVEPPERPDESALLELRKRLGILPGQFVIGSVGRMVDNHKLFSVLLKSFGQFCKARPDVRLLLVGDGVDRESLQQLAIDLGVRGSVIFAGHQADVRPYYAMMDIFALVPAREGFGLAAVEAMFFGLPVIASRVGGLRYLVEDGVSGMLVEPGDESALTNAMEQLYNDRTRAALFGQKGRQVALEKYTAKRYVEDLQGLYDSLTVTMNQ